MAYRRFYIEDIQADGVRISGDLFHHIRDVCRFQEGDRFEVLPGNKQAVLVEIASLGKKELFAKAVSTRALPELPRPYITLALSIPKLPKVDWIIEKCVELGAFEIRPFVSDFSFLRKTSEVSENRLARWNKLVQAATQQSGRGDLMRIQPATTLEKLLSEFNRTPATGGLFPYEGEARVALPQALRELKAKNHQNLWVFVGSEGGFSAREVELFASHGLGPVSLGEQILRVETACVALVSIIKYEYEQFEYGSIR
ncbi:MAG: 16S rRNA (uracil(1498)-N(3))-methyltransferase [Bdellovibrionales bacterium]|nr:16S rRNA (uracil(1498)-N(3))-methyltransferase [Bdellovibrionales bacterium]